MLVEIIVACVVLFILHKIGVFGVLAGVLAFMLRAVLVVTVFLIVVHYSHNFLGSRPLTSHTNTNIPKEVHHVP